MPVLFANPWGLLALLGIPVILAIHFLHRHRKAIAVSTLFLLDIAREPARSGHRWHRLIPSIPMWLQLLLVLLLAALLSKPYLPHNVLQVAVILDDSASMRVFRQDLADALTDLQRRTSAGGRASQWMVLSANPSRPRYYAGNEPAEWIAGLAQWEPAEGWRDPSAALRLAREKVGAQGIVVYVTDTPLEELPGGAAQLAVGRAIPNAGIGGISFNQTDGAPTWQAVLINPTATATQRQWHLEWDGVGKSQPQQVLLPAHGMATISGELPAQANRFVLRLDGDAFNLDDSFPFVRPAPKPLTMATLGGSAPDWLPQRMLQIIPRLSQGSPALADFALIGIDTAVSPPPVTGVAFSTASAPSTAWLGETVVATTHPLVRGLAWAGLAVQQSPGIPSQPGDEVLLWCGGKPLASLRMTKAPEPVPVPEGQAPAPAPPLNPAPGPQLILHFNPALSNFDRLPAGAVLLLRFTEMVRQTKTATSWEQLEPGQAIAGLLPPGTSGALTLETLAANGTVLASSQQLHSAHAAGLPGFLRVSAGQNVLIEAAIAFADARESDFNACASCDTTAQAITRAAGVSRPADDRLQATLLALAAISALLILYQLSGPADSARPNEPSNLTPEAPATDP